MKSTDLRPSLGHSDQCTKNPIIVQSNEELIVLSKREVLLLNVKEKVYVEKTPCVGVSNTT